jgi:hypothetical protein
MITMMTVYLHIIPGEDDLEEESSSSQSSQEYESVDERDLDEGALAAYEEKMRLEKLAGVHVYIYMYKHVYTCICVNTCVCVYTGVYIHICILMYILHAYIFMRSCL